MDLDALLLSRLQVAFTIAFHILFPAFTIGLAGSISVAGVAYVLRSLPFGG